MKRRNVGKYKSKERGRKMRRRMLGGGGMGKEKKGR